jgi:hypothetical protein
MKKILSALLTACVLSGAIPVVSNAQDIARIPVRQEFPKIIHESSGKEKINLTEVNAKAVRNFEKSFKQADNVIWYKVKDGFMVYFYQDGSKKISGYDPKGNWLCNLISYKEDKLPEQVWQQVKSVYYDCSITFVNEIQVRDKLIYIIHAEDKKSFKSIRVCGDEMNVIEEVQKI